MAHFAKIENNIVTQVIVAEQDFIDLINSYENELKGEWIQTSYNTYGNVHLLGGTPVRYNYAGVGSIYDHEKDGFYLPKPEIEVIEGEEVKDYVLNSDTLLWEEKLTK